LHGSEISDGGIMTNNCIFLLSYNTYICIFCCPYSVTRVSEAQLWIICLLLSLILILISTALDKVDSSPETNEAPAKTVPFYSLLWTE
jgi:hypothetical protein